MSADNINGWAALAEVTRAPQDEAAPEPRQRPLVPTAPPWRVGAGFRDAALYLQEQAGAYSERPDVCAAFLMASEALERVFENSTVQLAKLGRLAFIGEGENGE